MSFTCKSDVITIEELYEFYKNNQIVKPKIQRKKCWIDKDNSDKGSTNNYDFIKFILKTRNTVNPILFVQKYINEDRIIMIVIDGNNRVNAIIGFVERPLQLFDNLINEHFNDLIKEKLKKCSLINILDYLNFKEFCNNFLKDTKIYETIKKDFLKKNLIVDTVFKDLQSNLHKLKFLAIKIPITKFGGISDENICEIYEGVNRGGIKLTRQEILASTTSFNTYDTTQIDNFNKLKKTIKEYYDDMNNNELINIENKDVKLNLYEILLSTQIILHEKYKKLKLVEEPGKCALDMVFRLYEIIYGSFNNTNCDLNSYIIKINKIFDYIENIYKNFIFNHTINFKQISTYTSSISKNALIILIIDCFKNFDKITANNKKFCDKIVKIILYNELLNTLSDKEVKKEYDNHCLSYSKTRFTNKYAKDILDDKIVLLSVSNELMKTLYKKIIDLQIEHINKGVTRRKPLNKFKIIILSIYFNKCVPQSLLEKEKNNDHIIPFSIKKNNFNIDIDRLGNLVLIDCDTNRKKGDRVIDETFINDNKLNYYNYPKDNIVKEIMDNNKLIISETKYNNMCEKRENLYIDEILKLLS